MRLVGGNTHQGFSYTVKLYENILKDYIKLMPLGSLVPKGEELLGNSTDSVKLVFVPDCIANL